MDEYIKKKISLEIWLPVLTIFVYSASVLTQYGYISYFGLPSYLIEASVKSNIIYSFTILRIAWIIWPITLLLFVILLTFEYEI